MIIYVEDILNEGAKKKSDDLEGFVIIFYAHCLKYYYQTYKQGKSWINSIVENAITLYENIYIKNRKNINVSRELDSILHTLYRRSIPKAIDETGLNIKKLDKDEYIFNLFDSIDKIIDFKLLKAWLMENAYDEYVIELIENKYKEKNLN